MKKMMKMLTASALIVGSLAMAAGAASYENCADQLMDLGLFQGTEQGYELDRAPTRAEAGVMLVRLLGKEADAKALTYSAPFTDLETWEQPYVQYLYDNKLTTGATETTFEPESACSAQMYTTFLLRALGYSDAQGADFTYDKAIDYGTTLGLVDYANCNTTNFLRDNVAAMSYTALNTAVKGDTKTDLLDKLVADGAVDKTKAATLQKTLTTFDSYIAATSEMSIATKMDMTADVKATVKTGDKQVATLTMPMTMQADINTDKFDQSKVAIKTTIKAEVDKSLVAAGESTSIDQTMESYYTDGYSYANIAGKKTKVAMSIDAMMAQIGSLTKTAVQPLCMFESITQSGDTYTVTYAGATMNGMMNQLLSSMQSAMPTDQKVELGDITCKMTVKDGKPTSMNMAMAMSMVVSGQTMNMDMTMDCTIKALGDGVTVTLPTDLASYTEAAADTAA